MRRILFPLLATLLVWLLVGGFWLDRCDETVDCSGSGHAAYYAMYPLTALLLVLTVAAIVVARHRLSSRT